MEGTLAPWVGKRGIRKGEGFECMYVYPSEKKEAQVHFFVKRNKV